MFELFLTNTTRGDQYQAMQKQIVVIHGGDSFETYSEYLSFLSNFTIDSLDYFKQRGWKDNLQNDLGSDYDVILPRMPNKSNAKYEEWKLWFEKLVPLLDDKIVLVGHSLGGTFLAKYLSENIFPKEIIATYLVAACFGDNLPDYSLVDFQLPQSLSKLSQQSREIHLYHSTDDEVVPYTDLQKYKNQLPQARVHSFDDRGHFAQEHFAELVDSIKKLSSAGFSPQ